MRLFVTNEERTPQLDEQTISIDDFNSITHHPYIQSVKWTEVVIDLDDNIKTGYVRQLLKRSCILIPRIVNDTVTPRNVMLLIEIFPDHAAELMSSMKKSQDDLKEYVESLLKMYKCDSTY